MMIIIFFTWVLGEKMMDFGVKLKSNSKVGICGFLETRMSSFKKNVLIEYIICERNYSNSSADSEA